MTPIRRAQRFRGPAVVFAVLAPLLATPMTAGPAETPAAAIDSGSTETVYPYTMSGKIRLLFFWVGKDDVGGGNITLAQAPGNDEGVQTERIEVLFGSKPERVPGGHNRWGYAYETSYWRTLPGAAPELDRTIFEGFMRRSKESSMSELKKTSTSDTSFAFTGTRSEILPEGATAEIRYFTSEENFDYRHADSIQKGYQQRLETGGPPDKLKTLDNGTAYRTPFGFLGATRHLLESVVTDFHQDSKRFDKARPSVIYVHNAKRFRLHIKDIDYKKTFRMDNKSSPLAQLSDVASVDFRIEELGTDYKHNFTLWVPLRGKLAGIPVRIVDKPRWWLRVELELAPDATLLAALEEPSRESHTVDEGTN